MPRAERQSDSLPVDALFAAARPPKGIHAVTVVHRDLTVDVRTSGSDPGSEFFELGSITKTLAATLLATRVVDGALSLDRTVGSILGSDAGRAAGITLGQLATHTSGLPRLAPNSITVPFWPRDPYRFYGRRRLWAGLDRVRLKPPGTFAYSNLGYQLLGEVLARSMSTTFDAALTEAVLRPAGMATARCQPCPSRGLVHGHGPWLTAGRRWHDRLPGAGGVDATIHDLAAWAGANLEPDSTTLGNAVRLTHRIHHRGDDSTMGLGWVRVDGISWHNGATGGFHTVVALDAHTAIGALAGHTVSDDFELDAPSLVHTASAGHRR